MDEEVIKFLQLHSRINHTGQCHPTPKMVDDFIKGIITEKEFLDPQINCCNSKCKYYMHNVVSLDDHESENGIDKSDSHCFVNLALYILDGEDANFSTTFIGKIEKV